ncbi:low quality protein: uncharacterized protein k02a2.6-like [Plakobranchus ocellatus]|uniref:Low quality protein: uncharacterized protein k02a2.6-like n=1 Tax=Plakobranchus ocellatus TaxID=259542 RepID=A0AAV4BRF5_9GAST|nr:low quality protein: uncharacterized protein k02a2.6-like [Plakobranchus ocellatus]
MPDRRKFGKRLPCFLLKYRITPHLTNGVSPVELLTGRQLKSRLGLLYPSVTQSVKNQHNMRQKYYQDQSSRKKVIEPNQRVLYRNYGRGSKWVPGAVNAKAGAVSCKVQTEQHGIIRWHKN